MTDDILMDRIFKFFDTLNDGNITREEWIMGHNVFLKGTMDEQIEYCFNIYDLNADGFIRWNVIIITTYLEALLFAVVKRC